MASGLMSSAAKAGAASRRRAGKAMRKREIIAMVSSRFTVALFRLVMAPWSRKTSIPSATDLRPRDGSAGEGRCWELSHPATRCHSALAAVCWHGGRTRLFRRTVDLFFAGQGPWLFWSIGLRAIWSFVPPIQAFVFTRIWLDGGGTVIVWAASLSLLFFRLFLWSWAGGPSCAPPALLRPFFLSPPRLRRAPRPPTRAPGPTKTGPPPDQPMTVAP